MVSTIYPLLLLGLPHLKTKDIKLKLKLNFHLLLLPSSKLWVSANAMCVGGDLNMASSCRTAGRDVMRGFVWNAGDHTRLLTLF